MKNKEEPQETPQATSLATFTKEQLLASKKYQSVQRDVLNVVLLDGESYTLAQVEQLIQETMERKAN